MKSALYDDSLRAPRGGRLGAREERPDRQRAGREPAVWAVDGPGDNTLGANLGGGVEYFFTGRDTITGEVMVHFVPGRTNSLLADYDPRFWTIAAGYKRYF